MKASIIHIDIDPAEIGKNVNAHIPIVGDVNMNDSCLLYTSPGAVICPFYDFLEKTEIEHVLVRSEQNGAHEASGFARASGKAGVCIATSGPGATNLITGLATAYMDSIPLVAITGQVNSCLLYTSQTTDKCKHYLREIAV